MALNRGRRLFKILAKTVKKKLYFVIMSFVMINEFFSVFLLFIMSIDSINNIFSNMNNFEVSSVARIRWQRILNIFKNAAALIRGRR